MDKVIKEFALVIPEEVAKYSQDGFEPFDKLRYSTKHKSFVLPMAKYTSKKALQDAARVENAKDIAARYATKNMPCEMVIELAIRESGADYRYAPVLREIVRAIRINHQDTRSNNEED